MTSKHRPSVRDVTDWRTESETDAVKVESGNATFPDGYFFVGGVWKVTPAAGRPKYFFGESAWSDAERLARDIEWAAERATW